MHAGTSSLFEGLNTERGIQGIKPSDIPAIFGEEVFVFYTNYMKFAFSPIFRGN